MTHVVTEGTGRGAQIPGLTISGKTGTTNRSTNAWFNAFTGNLVGSVWFGNDDGSPMGDMTGGTLPALSWRDIMAYAHRNLDPKPPFGVARPRRRPSPPPRPRVRRGRDGSACARGLADAEEQPPPARSRRVCPSRAVAREIRSRRGRDGHGQRGAGSARERAPAMRLRRLRAFAGVLKAVLIAVAGLALGLWLTRAALSELLPIAVDQLGQWRVEARPAPPTPTPTLMPASSRTAKFRWGSARACG